MKKFFNIMAMLFVILIFLGVLFTIGGIVKMFAPEQQSLTKASVLKLNLTGIIGQDDKFLERLKKYRKDDKIKGVLVSVDSPGGIVGPSQAIYMELKRTREEFQKPVVVAGLGLMASGAYYAAVGADKILVTPGCLVGSIGAIMPFVNLERLMDWAKISRYSVKTGKYKDIGAEYRPMSEDERQLLQGLLDSVLVQFKSAIRSGRPDLKPAVLDENADGRIFTGEEAVRLGFADQVGTEEDARRLLGSMTGLGDDPTVFEPKASRMEGYFSLLEDGTESRGIEKWLSKALHIELRGHPLLIWPMYLGL